AIEDLDLALDGNQPDHQREDAVDVGDVAGSAVAGAGLVDLGLHRTPRGLALGGDLALVDERGPRPRTRQRQGCRDQCNTDAATEVPGRSRLSHRALLSQPMLREGDPEPFAGT